MMTTEQARRLWTSGFVNRWHTNTDPRLRNAQDTTDAHSARVAKLVFILSGISHTVRDDADLYNAMEQAILHDCPEKVTGDVGYETKRKVPEIRNLLQFMDESYWVGLGLEPLPSDLDPITALADQIDALMFCRLHAPDLWERDDWQAHYGVVLYLAEEAGCRDFVAEFIDGEIR